MKAFFSIALSFFCVLTITQAQSLDAPTSVNPIIDYLDSEGVETVFEQSIKMFISKEMIAEGGGCACLGDVNEDGSLNTLDVAPFVAAIQNNTYDGCADMNQDGNDDLLDVKPFVDKLREGGCGGGS